MIVDSSDEFRSALENALQNLYIIHHSKNGDDALQSAQRIRPDIMVLDLILAGLDGITLLHELRNHGIRPMVLATTRLYNDYVFDSAEELGIGYIIRKPCNPAAVAERVRDLSRRLNPKSEQEIDPEEFITAKLHGLRISPRHRGYDYLKEAVFLMAKDSGLTITKELYPAVGAKFQSTVPQVERSIRSAISAAWTQKHSHAWDELLPPGSDGFTERPSNGFLIAHLAEELRLRMSSGNK